jgi:hypothetical protein
VRLNLQRSVSLFTAFQVVSVHQARALPATSLAYAPRLCLYDADTCSHGCAAAGTAVQWSPSEPGTLVSSYLPALTDRQSGASIGARS